MGPLASVTKGGSLSTGIASMVSMTSASRARVIRCLAARSLTARRSPPMSPVSTQRHLAEGVGFEPTIRFPVYTLSKRAPSATRPSLQAWERGRNIVAREPSAPRRSPGPSSAGQPHRAGFAEVIAAELRRARSELRRAQEAEQRLRARCEIVALAQRQVETLPGERYKV